MSFGSVSSQRYFFWISVFLILLFTMLEPEALAGESIFTSLLFWAVQISILIPLLIITHSFLQNIRLFDHLNPWFKTGMAGFIASLIFIPIGLGIDYVLGLDDWGKIQTLKDALPLILEEAGGIIGLVTLTWIAINAPRILQLNFQSPIIIENKKSEPEKKTNPYILSLIPHALGRDIIYLMSELHYLRIVTTQGETLQLYNLQNAIDELKDLYDGMQTHRSYWVNKAHVDKIIGKAPDRKILTKQGNLIPISRRQYTAVKSRFE
ncbi:MAG: LytTR family DNA-binding domain-containing protein [Holosporaceae bacterium]|jgi:hypothetical protein